MMFKLLEKCNITFNQNTKLEKFIPQSIKLKASKKICLVHLSSRWINSYYKEKRFNKSYFNT